MKTYGHFVLFLIVICSTSLGFSQAADPISHGQYMYNTSGCVHCHSVDHGKTLSGGYAIASPFGTFYTPNISPDPKFGIGSWTEAEFAKALRDGISPKGEFYYPAFPFSNYSKMSDEDIASIWTYMKTLLPSQTPNQSNSLKAPFNDRLIMLPWRLLYFRNLPGQSAEEYIKRGRGPFQNVANETPQWNRGAYLVEGPLHCTQCHTPRDSLGGLIENKWMAGGPTYGQKNQTPNITPDPTTGVGSWSFDDWKTFLQTGDTPDGDSVGGDMAKLIMTATSQLTDDDLNAVVTYLRSIAPVNNKIQ